MQFYYNGTIYDVYDVALREWRSRKVHMYELLFITT